MLKKIEKQPSYGMIRITKQQGGAHSLFGSSIKHNNTICLSISQGSISRELNTDWYAEENKIIELELSPTQFADAITGIGTAVPCTITWKEKQGRIPNPEFKNKKEIFRDEFNKTTDKSAAKSIELISLVQELFTKKNLTKNDKETIIKQLNELAGLVKSHIKYITNCFDEQMEQSVSESKAEIEAFWQQKLNDIALAALKQQTDDITIESKPPELIESNNK